MVPKSMCWGYQKVPEDFHKMQMLKFVQIQKKRRYKLFQSCRRKNEYKKSLTNNFFNTTLRNCN